eukprot:PLAT7752.3.p1 GENE.PLAT7752.3~~PLAT7752.3.p1  ORF type:complete len:347 (+),score=102.61 PLAT7752.3:387-1427(+)
MQAPRTVLSTLSDAPLRHVSKRIDGSSSSSGLLSMDTDRVAKVLSVAELIERRREEEAERAQSSKLDKIVALREREDISAKAEARRAEVEPSRRKPHMSPTRRRSAALLKRRMSEIGTAASRAPARRASVLFRTLAEQSAGDDGKSDGDATDDESSDGERDDDDDDYDYGGVKAAAAEAARQEARRHRKRLRREKRKQERKKKAEAKALSRRSSSKIAVSSASMRRRISLSRAALHGAAALPAILDTASPSPPARRRASAAALPAASTGAELAASVAAAAEADSAATAGVRAGRRRMSRRKSRRMSRRMSALAEHGAAESTVKVVSAVDDVAAARRKLQRRLSVRH